MALERWQATITNKNGVVQQNATVEVRNESDDTLATIYSDRDGLNVKANPFETDSSGFAFFHADGGEYKITASKSGFSRAWRYVHLSALLFGQETQSIFGTDHALLSSVTFEDSSQAASASGNVTGILLRHKTAAGHVGGVCAFEPLAQISVAPDSISNTVSLAHNALLVHEQTADLSGFSGLGLEGASSSVLSFGGFVGAVAAHEFATGVAFDSTPYLKATLLLSDMGAVADTVFGSTWDARAIFSSAGGIGAKDQILFSDTSGSFPFPADGSGRIMRISGGSTPTITTGIDLSGATITGNAFKSNAFQVDGNGGLGAALVVTSSWMIYPEISTPATPAAGLVYLYAKSDHKMYSLGSDAVERALS